MDTKIMDKKNKPQNKPEKVNSKISGSANDKESPVQREKMKLNLFDFLVAGLMPLLVGKLFVFYFGIHYSKFPGQGYGTGLAISVLFTVVMLGRFLWKYRNYSE